MEDTKFLLLTHRKPKVWCWRDGVLGKSACFTSIGTFKYLCKKAGKRPSLLVTPEL